MQKVLKGLGILGAFVAVSVLSLGQLVSPAQASGLWDWGLASPSDWTDVVEHEGEMVWGQLFDTAEYEGVIWSGGRNTAGEGVLWRYDPLTGEMTNETPDGFDAANNVITSMTVYNGDLYFGTDNNDTASQLWVLSAGNWSQMTSYADDVAVGETLSLIEYGGRLCASGLDGNIEVWCHVYGVWTDLGIAGDTNAFHRNWRSSQLVTALDGTLYLDAQTEDNFYGIWEYYGGEWTQIETPFTDEEETGEVSADGQEIATLGVYNDDLIAVSMQDGLSYVWSYNGSTWTQLGPENLDGEFDNEYRFFRVVQHGDDLIVGSGAYGISVGMWRYDSDGDSWELTNEEYLGDPEGYDDGYAPTIVDSFTSTEGVLYASTATEGEGRYNGQLWRTPSFEGGDEETDSDSDNIGDAVENAGPNGGDADGDGVLDSEQPNVTSFVNSVTGKYIALKTTCDDNFNVQLGAESASTKDVGYDYPAGLLAFVIRGCTVGATVPVEVYYYGSYSPGDYIARKWRDGSGYSTIPSATFSTVTNGGEAAMKLSYSITDGGELDDDGIADGNIVDPVGPGISGVGTPNTGFQNILDFLSR